MSEISPSVFQSGFNGTAVLQGYELPVISWSISPTVELVTFKNSRSGPWVLRASTFKDASGTIEIDYDFANPLYSTNGPAITVSSVITNMQLFLHQTSRGNLDGSYWNVLSAIVDGEPQRLMNDGKITTSISWKNAGMSIQYPS